MSTKSVKPCTETHTCPLSGNDYRGSCQISNCWAQTDPKIHKSGCVYQALKKQDIGFSELSYIFDLPTKVIRNQIETAKQVVRCGIDLLDIIDDIQITKLCGCPTCGKTRNKASPCLNQIKCQKRVSILADLQSNEFFARLDRPLINLQFYKLLASHRAKVVTLLQLTETQDRKLELLFGENELSQHKEHK